MRSLLQPSPTNEIWVAPVFSLSITREDTWSIYLEELTIAADQERALDVFFHPQDP
jgi:hypothetical protein